MTLTVGSLFSGIGGLDLGLERAGMEVIWQSEIDPYCNKVLKKHWPKVINHGNIKDINWGTVERPDIICGGYPCQPFSLAGQRNGTDDPRHLWPWVRDAISALRPSYAILENVRGHLTLGGIQVIGELAEIGYDAEWRVVSAAGLGAPHRRDRIIIVAYPEGSNSSDGGQCEDVPSQTRSRRNDRSGSRSNLGQVSLESTRESTLNVADTDHSRSGTSERRIDSDWAKEIKEQQNLAQFGLGGCSANVADSDSGRQQECNADERFIPVTNKKSNGNTMADSDCKQLGERRITKHSGQTNRVWQHNDRGQTTNDQWQWWEVEPQLGRVADGIPDRVDRLKGLGNAVVPQVAEYIGRLVMAAELNNS